MFLSVLGKWPFLLNVAVLGFPQRDAPHLVM